MYIYSSRIALFTIVWREVERIIRIWTQTLLPPVITMSLYFLIFGHVVGNRIGHMDNLPYIQFIAPGLIMMSVITNSYGNVVSSFYGARFQRSIEEMLVTPTPDYIIMTGYILGGVCRGLLIGGLVTCLSLAFTHLQLVHPWITLVIILLSSVLFSLLGFSNALFANKFDDITIIPTFVLTPLTYLGGVFYSIDLLPTFWNKLSHLNPILYMVNGFRYGILGISDIPVSPAIAILLIFTFVLAAFNLYLMKYSNKLRN